MGGDVVDPDPGAVEAADRVGDRALAAADRDLQDAVARLGPLAGERLERGAGGLDLGRVLEGDVEALAADLVLELVGGALGDHLAAVDHRDPVGEAVGLVEVLGGEQDGRAGGDPLLDRLPEADPAARVEAGRRLVEEEHRRAGDERGGEVEPAAHPARVGADQALGGVGEFEVLEQLGGAARPARPWAGGRGGRPSPGSRRRSGFRRPPRTGRRGRSACAAAPRSRGDVEAGDPGAAAVGVAAAW